MRWSAGPNAGFCPPSATPWLPVGELRPGDDVEAQRADPGSMLTFTAALLRYRRSSRALLAGTWRPLDAVPDSVVGFIREVPGERIVVLLNLASDTLDVRVPGPGTVELATGGATERVGERVGPDGRVTLSGYEGVIVHVS
jgi:alpha-glucosidase